MRELSPDDIETLAIGARIHGDDGDGAPIANVDPGMKEVDSVAIQGAEHSRGARRRAARPAFRPPVS